MTGAVCRGDWVLGSACGQCARCVDTALDGAKRLVSVVKELRALSLGQSEYDALWSWHHEEEFRAAGRQDYDAAKHHNQRASQIHPMTSFGRKAPA